MIVIPPIPDDLAARPGEAADVSRRALEAFAAEEHRAGRLTHPDPRRLPGFGTPAELDGFLKPRGMQADGTAAEASVPGIARERPDADQTPSPVVARFRAFRAGRTLGGLDPAALIREGRR
jgi:hypothetical protein